MCQSPGKTPLQGHSCIQWVRNTQELTVNTVYSVYRDHFPKLNCHVTWYCQTRLQHEFEIFEYAALARMQACRKLDILDSVAICYSS